MPLYYFNLVNGDVTLDEEGQDLPDAVRQIVLYGSGGERFPVMLPPGASDGEQHAGSLWRYEGICNEIERRYLSQASAAFRADLPDAAAVMLGAASEHLLLQLGAAIENADPIDNTSGEAAEADSEERTGTG